MGYRIDFALREETLQAVVSGRAASKHANGIARDIAEQAKREARTAVLIDLRRLEDRVGMLSMMLGPKPIGRRSKNYRVAVLDTENTNRYYVFAELAARSSGYTLRYFSNAQEALDWLHQRP